MRDGISVEAGLLKDWPEGGPPLVFKVSGVGEGYSSFSVSDGRLFTLGARGEDEFVIAVDAETGRPLWSTRLGRRFKNDRGDGPRSTPTVDGDRLYAFGASGDLACVETKTGRVVWSVNLLSKLKGKNITWGLSESPLLADGRLYLNPGAPQASIVAVLAKDGSIVWASEDDEAGYSSAMPMDVGGVPLAVFFTGERALGVRRSDGRLLWAYPKVSNETANVATPVVRGSRVFVSSDYGTGAALLELLPVPPGVNAREVYFTSKMRNHWSSSVLVGDHLYGFSSTLLTALRLDDGAAAWRDRSVGKGSVIYADGRLYAFSERGEMALGEATPVAYREHGRVKIEAGPQRTYALPVIANGRLYLREQDTLYAFDIREKK